MRKWFVPLTVLGVGGIGAFLLSEKGRETLRRWRASFNEAPERWAEWNDSAQLELDRIQTALNRIADSLGPHSEMGR
jgi:DNA-binding PadR family transcriptional regulator